MEVGFTTIMLYEVIMTATMEYCLFVHTTVITTVKTMTVTDRGVTMMERVTIGLEVFLIAINI